ncbi:MAG: toll/interleukin-1 receptor domain-containing protein [Candidatus Methylomirabilis oxyfera]|nr:toll/interleukin-1 receptor domain-containing protein [Candidatus Methylomirabilis oxyfera]
MTSSQGFWSYIHADDITECERISRLARDVAGQFEMLTGEPLALFPDRDAIKWGENWQNKVDSSLASVAFFIPVLTPRFFMSPECRRELQFFARKATQLGLKELVLPLLYVDVPALHDDTQRDDLVALVRTFQWEDWRELRFADLSAESYRKAVARLAARLVEANRQVETVDVATIALEAEEATVGSEDDSPGYLDRVASAEDTLPKLVETIEAIGRDIELIGQTMQEAIADIQRGAPQAKGFAARLLVARKVARQLAEPADRVWSFGNEFVSQLHEVDQGFRAIIERAASEVQQNPDSKTAVCAFFAAVRSMSTSAHVGLGSAQGMIDAIGPIEKMSRDLRPVLRRLRQGLTTMVEAREVSDEWLHLIERSGISCDDRLTDAS